MCHYSMQSIQNLGLAIVSLLAGVILDARGYILLEVFFLALLCGALIAGVVLYMYDAAKGECVHSCARMHVYVCVLLYLC